MKKLIANPFFLRFGDVLKHGLSSREWTNFNAAIAFVKKSGVKYIENELKDFLTHANASITVGVDLCGTSYDGLELLLNCMGERGEIFIYHNNNQSTFHPKLYMFHNDSKASVLIGSGNLTEGGLFVNYEIGINLQLDLLEENDNQLYNEITEIFKSWSTVEDGLCLKLTPQLLEQLKEIELVPQETMDNAKAASTASSEINRAKVQSLFKRTKIKPSPTFENKNNSEHQKIDNQQTWDIEEADDEIFIMTLQNTDVGTGQLNPNTSRRSPEIFIPLKARDTNPSFWDWPDAFLEHHNRHTRDSIPVIMGNEIFSINMMTWHLKHDFRIRSEKLRSAGEVGDILVVEKLRGNQLAEYQIAIIAQNSPKYEDILALCTNPVPNSNKKWAYSSATILQNAGFVRS